MKKILKILVLLFVFFFSINVYAYTKADIVILSKTFKACENDTEVLVNDLITSYTKLIEERDISNNNLNTIYNNLNTVLNILKEKKVCSENDLSGLDRITKDKLKDLYAKTNNIIKSSRKLSDNSISDINIIMDTTNKTIKIYDGDSLKDVISTTSELKYVGLNKTIIIIIVIFALLLILSIIKNIIKKDIITTSMIYTSIILLTFTLAFKDKLSLALDYIPKNHKEIETKVIVKDKTIISYPSYGSSYGTIKINDKEEKIYYGDTPEILKSGVGTSSLKALPGINNTILLGHNTHIFKELFNIKKKDKIYIETIYGNFEYEVINKKVINKTDKLTENDLILYTCYPNSSLYGNERLVVYGKLIESEWLDEKNT